MSSDPKAEQLANELANAALAGLSESEARAARAELSELAVDWLREAGTDKDAPAILDLLRASSRSSSRASLPSSAATSYARRASSAACVA